MSGDTTASALPTVVIGGYLGAGKTTLVNRLLRHAASLAGEFGEAREDREFRKAGECSAGGAPGGPLRIAVLVNDFGEVSIDADLIVGAEGAVLSLAGGCVCCSFGADLVGALEQVAARAPRPHVVLIETSGVGLPAAVARTAALLPQVRVEAIVVVADACAVRRQAGERYVGSTVRRQLQEADLLLLGKTDLLEPTAPGVPTVPTVPAVPAVVPAVPTVPPALEPLEAWLREAGFKAPCVAMPAPGDGDGDEALADLVLGPALVPGARDTAGAFAPRPMRAAAHFVAHTRRFDEPVDVAALGEALRSQGVLRAKGLLLDITGRWQELQLAGGRVHQRPAAAVAGTAGAAARVGAAPSAAAAPAATAATAAAVPTAATVATAEVAATAAGAEAAEAAGRLVTITLRRP